jgi:GT2 family glycosyltransferase
MQRRKAQATGSPPHAPQPSGTKLGVLVLGMHRSGTSAVARVHTLLGLDAGEVDELLPAHPSDNPKGYWERSEINALHDALLASAGHTWYRVAGFDARRLDPEASEVAGPSQRLRELVSQWNARGRPWLVKDPRLCLLLPVWQRIGASCAHVVVVRDPREIAASLTSGPRGTFPSAFVLALWEKYQRMLLRDLAGARAVFIAYDALLADPLRQCERLRHGLAELGIVGLHAATDRDVIEFLDRSLRRSKPQRHATPTAAQEALYRWLRRCCETDGPTPVDSATAEQGDVDAVLAEFEASFAFHREQGRAEAKAGLVERMTAIEAQIERYQAEQNRWLAELAAQRDAAAQARAEAAAERQRSLAIEAQIERYQAEQNRWLAELAAQRDAAAQAQAEAAAVATELREQSNARERLAEQLALQTAELAEARRHAGALADSLQAMRASWSWRLTAPLRAVGRLLDWRPRGSLEQRLYRLYYAVPGVSPARKRAGIVWLHEHVPWLTRHTLSYRLYRHSRELEAEQARQRTEAGPTTRRMDAVRATALIAQLPRTPRISIVMPVYDVEPRWLMAAVNSVRRQFYPHWQLCIADDGSRRSETRAAIDAIERLGDPRIQVRRLPTNRGIALASNAALELAHGEYVGLLDHDDELTRDALLEVALRIVADDPDVIYSDEDKLDPTGQHCEPHFKPDFNLDYFLSVNYLCHFTVLRRTLLQQIGGFRTGFDGAQDYDLFLRATERCERIAHIPKVLYHWRQSSTSTAATSAAKPQAWDAGLRALGESLARRGIDATVERGPYPTTYRVRRALRGQPLVTILIPFRDKPELLATCVESILERSDYPHFEILGIDNGSREPATHRLLEELRRRDARVRFVRYDAPFNFSAINNFGARHARGEHLLFLNNDTEVIARDWLRALLEHSQRPEVGVVGAKLLYADGSLQHAGVIIGIGGVAGHAHLFAPGDDPGYFGRAQLPQRLSAVTFACAMSRRAVFEQLHGLDERELTVAFNDIDYCLRAVEIGYQVIYTPFAVLYHHESRSRGYEDDPEKQARFAREVAYMQRRHRLILERGDPYYNPNLRLDCNDFRPRPGYAEALPV